MNFFKRNGIMIFGVILAVSIFIFRFQSQELPKAAFIEEGSEIVLNTALFEEVVRNAAARDSLTTLYVFLDLKRSCPSQVGEAQAWREPLFQFPDDTYGLTIFMPAETPDIIVQDFMDTYGVHQGNIQRYQAGQKLSKFGEHGLLKVLYSLENGVILAEYGNDGAREWDKFKERLIKGIRTALG